MKNKTKTAKVTITSRDVDLAGLFDMLRYDRCTVESWSHDGDPAHARQSTYTLTLRSRPDATPGFEFTKDRWASFGLRLRVDGEEPTTTETFNISQHFPYGGPLVTPPPDGRPGGWDYPAHFDPMTGKDKDR